MDDLIEAFRACEQGDRAAFDRVFAQMYPDLVHLARSRLRGGQRMTLVDTTMLVHECFLRFVQSGRVRIENRAHFFAYAARVMRSIIVDEARKRQAAQRGGNVEVLDIHSTGVENQLAAPEDRVIEIAQAVERLAKVDERLASVIEMRFFAGFTETEIAEALGVTDRTVRRDFEKARMLLVAALG